MTPLPDPFPAWSTAGALRARMAEAQAQLAADPVLADLVHRVMTATLEAYASEEEEAP